MVARARIVGAASCESGAWLNAVPCSSVGTLLDGDSVRIGVGLRLGTRLCVTHKCVCGMQVDERGTHGLSCKRSAGRIPRHSELNSIISRALTSAGFPSILEPPGMCRADSKRPDGLTLFPWKRGLSLSWDSTCADTLAPSSLAHSAMQAGSAACTAEKAKENKYAELEGKVIFVPLGFETIGAWGSTCLKTVKELGNLIKKKTGETRSGAFLMQRLSVAIQRGNAAAILGSAPRCRPLEEIFQLSY